MPLLTDTWLVDFSIAAAAVLMAGYLSYGTWLFTAAVYGFASVYLFYQYKFQHWRTFRIPVSRPYFPLGDVTSILFKSPGEVLRDIYDKGSGYPFLGIWFMFRPAILLRDPELIKNILVKDFAVFHERGIYFNKTFDPLSGHIFAMRGQKWRNLRAKLTPTFTSGKLKAMFPQFVHTANTFETILTPLAEKSEVVDVKELAVCYATDLTTLTSLGITTHALTDPNDAFRTMGRKILRPSIITIMRSLLPFVVPDLSALFGVITVPMDVTKMFKKAIRDIVEYREENSVKCDDFMGIMCELRRKRHLKAIDGMKFHDSTKDEAHEFTMNDLAAECLLFFVSGFETPAAIISWAIYQLALDQPLQDKTRQEIHRVLRKFQGKLSIEAVHEMTYMDRVLQETLRMYPPVPLILRQSSAPYQFPETDFVLPKGTQVHISVPGLHRDPQYFPDPDHFDPERFTEEGKASRHHYAYLPFGEGPRNCFGMRYTMLQKKVGLITMLNKFQFSLAEESPYPLSFDPESFIYAAKGGLKLKITQFHQ